MSRFVKPEIDTLPLSGGDTITVRRRLNHGEQSAAYARMYAAGVDGHLRVNPLQSGRAQVTAYLIDWTLTDDSGQVVPLRDPETGERLDPEAIGAILDNLDPESFAEIRAAIDAHEAAQVAKRAEEKKILAGANGS